MLGSRSLCLVVLASACLCAERSAGQLDEKQKQRKQNQKEKDDEATNNYEFEVHFVQAALARGKLLLNLYRQP